MPAKKIYILRGNIPFGLDRDYFISMDGKKTEIIGDTKTMKYELEIQKQYSIWKNRTNTEIFLMNPKPNLIS